MCAVGGENAGLVANKILKALIGVEWSNGCFCLEFSNIFIDRHFSAAGCWDVVVRKELQQVSSWTLLVQSNGELGV